MPQKRTPQKTPGDARYTSSENDNFMLPSILYQESIYFYYKAKTNEKKLNRYLRASLYCASSFVEATLNQIAYAHSQAHAANLGQIEKDVLEEYKTTIDDKGDVIRKSKFYSLESRLSFLTQFLSGKRFDKSGTLWQKFIQAKKLRDYWTHPKPPFDTDNLKLKDVKNAIKTFREVLIEISKLMEIDPPLWLCSASQPDESEGDRNDLPY